MVQEITAHYILSIAAVSIGNLILIACLYILSERNLKLKKIIQEKESSLFVKKNSSRTWFRLSESLAEEIVKLRKEITEYKFVMAISDDISAEMQREIEELSIERDTLKAKLNHKKRPVK